MMELQNSKMTVLVAPGTNLNTAARSANLDCLNADYATIVANFAAELNTNATGPVVSLLSCDTTVVSNFVTITADRTEDLTTAHGVVYHVDMRSGKRYLRLTVTPATTTNDTVNVSALAFTGKLASGPASTAGMIGTTNDAAIVI